MEPTHPTAESEPEPGALEEAFQEYRDLGLRLPPVPRELVDELDEFAERHWGTEKTDLENDQDFLVRANDPAAEPMVGFGHVGHGVNSWWLCYQLILPSLAVYVRLSFGGAYGDVALETAVANKAAEQLESLIVGAEAAANAGLIPAGQRLLVLLDTKTANAWRITADATGWRETDSPIEDALAFCGA
jgi:hypothetical protein